jgi:hypothetical protein
VSFEMAEVRAQNNNKEECGRSFPLFFGSADFQIVVLFLTRICSFFISPCMCVVHRQRRWSWHPASAGCHPHDRSVRTHPLLPRFVETYTRIFLINFSVSDFFLLCCLRASLTLFSVCRFVVFVLLLFSVHV